jgi:hypothetical protein
MRFSKYYFPGIVMLLVTLFAGRLLAATVSGTLRDIQLEALDTKLLITPTNEVLVSGSELSVGPPLLVDTTNGEFTVVLDAGDYTVSLPLVPWRKPFLISVFPTNGAVNIANLLAAPRTYTYTNNLDFRLRATAADHQPDLLDAKLRVAGSLTRLAVTNGDAVSLVLSNRILPRSVTCPAVPINLREASIAVGRDNANQSGTLRWQILPATACHDLQLVYVNYYRAAGQFIAPNTNPIWLKAALELNGNILPVYFHGARTNVLENGGVSVSDPIPVCVRTNDSIFVRTFFSVPAGGYIPTGILFNGTGSGTGNDAISYGVDATDGGALNSCSQPVSWGPLGVLAVPDSGVGVGVVMVGDSILNGTGESWPNTSSSWARPWGFLARALSELPVGYVKLSSGGDTASNFVATGCLRIPASRGATIAVCNYGINDIIYGYGAASIRSNLLATWQYFGSKGLKVYQTTISPKTSSTDLWSSIAGQSVGAYESNRVSLNSWLRDTGPGGANALSGGMLSGVLDVAAAVESQGAWIAPDAPCYSGTLTGAGSNYALDANQNTLAAHSLDYCAVIRITGGLGAGQIRTITANSPQNKYYINSWTTQPDATSTYEIWITPTGDGVHPYPSSHAVMAAAIDTNLFLSY